MLAGRPADDGGWQTPGLFGQIKPKAPRRPPGMPPLGTGNQLPARDGPYTLAHKLSDIASLAASLDKLTVRLNAGGVGSGQDFSGTSPLPAPPQTRPAAAAAELRDGF